MYSLNIRTTVNMAEITFFLGGGGVGEIQCVIFQQNNFNPYRIHNNYIELSIDFHSMIIFLGNRKI